MTLQVQLTAENFAAACDEVVSAYENGEWERGLKVGRRCCEFAHQHFGAAHPVHRWCVPAECARTAGRISATSACTEVVAEAAHLHPQVWSGQPPVRHRFESSTGQRREVTVLFAGLRDFTPFVERAEPAAVMAMLQEFHGEMTALVRKHEGTIERFAEDGMRVLFYDPEPLPDHTSNAVSLACAMQAPSAQMSHSWRGINGPSGLGIGLSQGLATVGAIASGERMNYAAVGSVTLVCPSL